MYSLLAVALFEGNTKAKGSILKTSGLHRESSTSPAKKRRFLIGVKNKSALPKITVEELRQNNIENSLWVAIEGKVYDLTDFVSKHPGGRQILLCASGRDATEHFIHYHGPKERAILKKFLIGELQGCDLPVFPKPDKFAETLRARVEGYFARNGIDPKHSPAGLVHHVCVLLTFIVLTYLQWQPWVVDWKPLFYLIAVLYGIAQLQMSVTIIHDGSHGSLTHNPTLWTIMASGHDYFNGCSSVIWMYQHIISHHAFTNVDEIDVDIETSDKDFRRIKEHQKYHAYYIPQALYCPLLYVFLGTSLRIRDFVRAFGSGPWGSMHVNPLTVDQTLNFFAGKIFFLCHRIVFPYLFAACSWKAVLAAFLVSDFTSSFSFAIIAQASHVAHGASVTRVGEDGKVDDDWMRMQIRSSIDYAHGSWLTTKFTGSLNYQVAHHLFPNVAQAYHPQIAPIIMQTCDEFGVQYTVRKSMWEAIGGHLGLLHQLGSPPDMDHF